MPGHRDDTREILVMTHARMSVVARDPQMRVVPASLRLELRAQGVHGIVDDAERLQHYLAFVAVGMRRLVHSCERREHERRAMLAHLVDHAVGDIPVDS